MFRSQQRASFMMRVHRVGTENKRLSVRQQQSTHWGGTSHPSPCQPTGPESIQLEPAESYTQTHANLSLKLVTHLFIFIFIPCIFCDVLRLQGQGDLTHQSATAWGQTRLRALFLEISLSSVVFCSLLCVSILTCSDSSPSSFIVLPLHLALFLWRQPIRCEQRRRLSAGEWKTNAPPPTSLPRPSALSV